MRTRLLLSVSLAALLLSSAFGLATLALATSAPASGPAAAPTFSADSSPLDSGHPFTLSSDFWGLNVRAFSTMDSTASRDFVDSSAHFAIWPSGRVGDEYDYATNTIYYDSGSRYSPPFGLVDFVHWCESVRCGAIIQLPGEINDPGLAANEVRYVEDSLHFHPAYWEIGNEPAHWTHFGVAWSDWRTSQHTAATPSSYAALVHNYLRAIRAVDPNAPVIGLPGVGTGAYQETTWLTDTVRENGPELAAVAIHVYPAGGTGGGSEADFFHTLTDASSLSVRVPPDRAAITAACRSCHIALLVTEMGSGNQGNGYQRYIDSWPEVPFLAAEIAQGMSLDLTNMDVYAFMATYGGALFLDSTHPQRVDTLYTNFFAPLGNEVLGSEIDPAAGLFAVSTYDTSSHTESVLVTNTGGGSLRLDLAGTALGGTGSITEKEWFSYQSGPAGSTHSRGLGGAIEVPSAGVVLIQIHSYSTSSPVPTPSGNGAGSPGAGTTSGSGSGRSGRGGGGGAPTPTGASAAAREIIVEHVPRVSS